jgi:hypothetical protein
MPAVRSIAHDAARNNYRFTSLIMGIVNSTPFGVGQLAKLRPIANRPSQGPTRPQ